MAVSQIPSVSKVPALNGLGEKLAWYFQDSTTLFLFLAVPVALCLYYLIVNRIGFRKPAQAELFIHKPPRDLPATAVHYIYTKGFDTKCLLIAVINAGLKGCYRIRWTSKGFLAVRSQEGDFSQLSKEERKALTIYSDKYWDNVTIAPVLSRKNKRMSLRMEKYMKRRYRKLFRKKLVWKILGPILAFGMCMVLFSQAPGPQAMNFFFIYVAIFGLFIVVPIVFLRQVLGDRYVYGIVHSLIYLGVGIFALGYIESQSHSPLYSLSIAPAGLIVFLFNIRLSTYSRSGHTVMNEIEAYRRSLQIRMEKAETEEGNYASLADEIPYILALDLEAKFTGYFNPMLSRTKYEPYQIFNQIYKS